MASRLLAVKRTSFLAAETLKWGQLCRMKIQSLERVFSTSVTSQHKDGCELLNRGRRGGQLCQRRNYLPVLTAYWAIYPFTSWTTGTLGAPIPTRRLHSASDCGEHQVRDSRTRQVRVRSENDPLITRSYEEVFEAITDIDPHEPALQDALKKCREAAEYNLPGGKCIRLLALVHAYELLAEESRPHLELACMLGWCMELLLSYYMVIDDVMDESQIRRGRPSWYTVPGVGLRAISDALFLEKATRRVIHRRLGHLRCYKPLRQLIHDCELRTVLGQGLDMKSEKLPLDQWNANRYWAIASYKTGHFSVLHIRAAMMLAGMEDSVLHAKAEKVALHLGRVYQVQDDFLDTYGDPKNLGKVGMDIVQAKCSWLAVKALELASPAQRAVLESNLGKGVPGGPEEAAVKAVYEDLDLRGHYTAYEKRAFAKFDNQLRDLPEDLAAAFRFMRDVGNRTQGTLSPCTEK